MHLFNNKKMIGHIGICQHAQPYKFSLAQELRDFVEPEYRKVYRDVFTQDIFNGTRAITIARKLGPLRFGNPKERASFAYMINDVTNVNGVIYLSQEEAIKLIYSIHAELKEKPAPKQEAVPTGIDLVQKLKQLKDAFEADLISGDEYQVAKRQVILSK